MLCHRVVAILHTCQDSVSRLISDPNISAGLKVFVQGMFPNKFLILVYVEESISSPVSFQFDSDQIVSVFWLESFPKDYLSAESLLWVIFLQSISVKSSATYTLLLEHIHLHLTCSWIYSPRRLKITLRRQHGNLYLETRALKAACAMSGTNSHKKYVHMNQVGRSAV